MMKAVLITTQHRGVFFGYLEDGVPATCPESIVLKNAQNCLYWSADVKGFIGLAVTGPTSGCRIGPNAEFITLYNVTSIVDVTEEAESKWREQPWE